MSGRWCSRHRVRPARPERCFAGVVPQAATCGRPPKALGGPQTPTPTAVTQPVVLRQWMTAILPPVATAVVGVPAGAVLQCARPTPRALRAVERLGSHVPEKRETLPAVVTAARARLMAAPNCVAVTSEAGTAATTGSPATTWVAAGGALAGGCVTQAAAVLRRCEPTVTATQRRCRCATSVMPTCALLAPPCRRAAYGGLPLSSCTARGRLACGLGARPSAGSVDWLCPRPRSLSGPGGGSGARGTRGTSISSFWAWTVAVTVAARAGARGAATASWQRAAGSMAAGCAPRGTRRRCALLTTTLQVVVAHAAHPGRAVWQLARPTPLAPRAVEGMEPYVPEKKGEVTVSAVMTAARALVTAAPARVAVTTEAGTGATTGVSATTWVTAVGAPGSRGGQGARCGAGRCLVPAPAVLRRCEPTVAAMPICATQRRCRCAATGQFDPTTSCVAASMAAGRAPRAARWRCALPLTTLLPRAPGRRCWCATSAMSIRALLTMVTQAAHPGRTVCAGGSAWCATILPSAPLTMAVGVPPCRCAACGGWPRLSCTARGRRACGLGNRPSAWPVGRLFLRLRILWGPGGSSGARGNCGTSISSLWAWSVTAARATRTEVRGAAAAVRGLRWGGVAGV